MNKEDDERLDDERDEMRGGVASEWKRAVIVVGRVGETFWLVGTRIQNGLAFTVTQNVRKAPKLRIENKGHNNNRQLIINISTQKRV